MNDRRTADVMKQPQPWSVMFPNTASDETAEPDMQAAAGVPTGFKVSHKRSPSTCRHEGNPRGYTWCKHCGTRIA
jgi:hypothetical protein